MNRALTEAFMTHLDDWLVILTRHKTAISENKDLWMKQDKQIKQIGMDDRA